MLQKIHEEHQCQHVTVTLQGTDAYKALHIYNVQLERFGDFQCEPSPEMVKKALRWFVRNVGDMSLVGAKTHGAR